MTRSKIRPVWTPGCGLPHPEIELIKAWAEGKIMLVEKQRITCEGRPYGEPVRTQFPCWNPEGWKFDVAKNSQMSLDLAGDLVSNKKVSAPKTLPPVFRRSGSLLPTRG